MMPPREPRDPLARRKERHVPPSARSGALVALSARAALGRFVLQRCTDCSAVTYPPRDICPRCWGPLAWEDQPRGARVVAATTIRVTTDLYFRDHLPWRIGTVALDAGPTAIVHLDTRLKLGDRAVMRLVLDPGGDAALFAMPEGGKLMDDRQGRAFVVPVRGRSVLVTDGDSAVGQAVVRAVQAAGAAAIVAGSASPAQPRPVEEGVRRIGLDLTDTRSVAQCFAGIAGPLDIVVNTARLVRPGAGLVDQKRMLDLGVVGLLRLTEASAPLLASRPAGAFVDLLSTHALAPDAAFAAFSAAEAARHALVQSFRHRMRSEGVRVMTIFAGPIDDQDHQSLPLPRLAPARLGQAVVEALETGREESFVGETAADALARRQDDPALYAREKNR
ncbi:short chain dehydrogenase family protein [Sphingomonas sp. S17]|jgi:NAD(P)-dependent dehydrogenase (short-subunit alcohol dehydrogenase family)/uncharacterized OB-fold protein|uniref:SDR family NAD(P)-dependent oxidoreductase n=3 Tax=Sphingomonas paucimobilis TaxID=13689 RepID=A0A7T3ACV1_SPHPI|nr:MULTISPECIES: SDR family NAD(P)-dependent oxidoreductase [Sphingomonas]EGI54699.1 short chain dehydrogenase family protein [Sphingomonas sp. S17]MBQ1481755.1 SDR family NAD(P)-dependent oxidoreductase [Sphingomonas sp.]MCM3681545.1 SDR family NAD(P)-dependent oxidoreductase [Sphingomonas paucimobilis]MDG5970234.1 SDR family NAD(P)-dependent oxidoreductase [Sphingomonas paucimobilis]QPS14973.1 SDR family NAD(P)-dependent oxidoreductase [Sphingomonas paucimobilis]